MPKLRNRPKKYAKLLNIVKRLLPEMGDLVQSSEKKSLSGDQKNNLNTKKACDQFHAALGAKIRLEQKMAHTPSSGGFAIAMLRSITVHLINSNA
ncbi:MAG: hypothetical protein CMM01_07265 [Rhodopirellula sp.]|nr:hypothetical protein [Rhodopirellula sp.]